MVDRSLPPDPDPDAPVVLVLLQSDTGELLQAVPFPGTLGLDLTVWKSVTILACPSQEAIDRAKLPPDRVV